MRWAAGLRVVSFSILKTVRWVRSRVEAAGAIGHRHEFRIERLQPADRPPQLLLGLRRLRRAELEGDVEAARAAAAGAGDGPQSAWIGRAGIGSGKAALMRPSGMRSASRSARQDLDGKPLRAGGRQGGRGDAGEAGGGEPGRSILSWSKKPSRRWAMFGAQEFQVVRREIGDQQPSARRHEPARASATAAAGSPR